jgi:glycerate 2-kinase
MGPAHRLRHMFDAAVKAADPAHCLAAHLPEPPAGRTLVIGAGKAGASMARALEQAWSAPIDGLIVTRYGHRVPCDRIEVVEAAHPVPDEKGLDAARRMLEAVKGLGPDDLVICLISGGGSALLTLPGEGISLADKQAVNRALLKSGANITEMNTVRKHLSAIKGGRLAAAAHPARVLTLAISDVPGDDPATVASGPTVPDTTTVADARAVLEKYCIEVPSAVAAFLATPEAETPKPGDPRLATAEFRFIATPMASLEAAADVCRDAGLEPQILGDDLEGEARELARDHAELARSIAQNLKPGDKPVALISGGETTVTVRGGGRGGRNAEYLLALTIALDGSPGIHAIACDTDGIDGSEDNAGAITMPDTLARAAATGLDAAARLADNDGYTFFKKLDDLVMTGPTLTNVNDFRAILIHPPGSAV